MPALPGVDLVLETDRAQPRALARTLRDRLGLG
jgi:hypothetical protein